MNFYSESGYDIFHGSNGAGGIDLPFYDEDLFEVTLQPGESRMLKTGIHLEIPKGHVGILDTRSSTGKKQIDLLCRTIDSDFRGNIRIMLINHNSEPVTILRGDYIAQIIVLSLCKDSTLVRVNSLDKLGKTARGSNGFGSTGNTNLKEDK